MDATCIKQEKQTPAFMEWKKRTITRYKNDKEHSRSNVKRKLKTTSYTYNILSEMFETHTVIKCRSNSI